MTTFQGLTATQWRNRINEYNLGMYSKEFLKNKTAKELAQIQNGKSYGVSESKSAAGSKFMSAIRAKLDAIKKLIGALQSAQANNPKAKAKVQEWDPDSDDGDESDESEEE